MNGDSTRDPEESGSETARIQRVYQEYAGSDRKRAAWSAGNQANVLILETMHRCIREALTRAGHCDMRGKRLLEVGCGAGGHLALFAEMGADPTDLHGVDVIATRVEMARKLYPGMNFVCRDAQNLPYPDGRFDYVILSVVFSSILDDGVASRVAGEVSRVLSSGGAIVWYDMRYPNPFNRHVRAISRANLAGLFPGYDLDLRTATLLPPLARALRGKLLGAYQPLCRIPLLRSHYVGLISRASGARLNCW